MESAGLGGFSGRNVERMAIHGDVPRGTSDGDAGGTGSHVLPAADPARFGAGASFRGILHRAGGAAGSFSNGVSQGGQRKGRERRNPQGRHVSYWSAGTGRWDGGRGPPSFLTVT